MDQATTSLTVTVELDPPVELGLAQGTISLDESRAPYAEARISVPLPDAATVAAITPYAGLRVTLEATKVWDQPTHAPQARTFDLYLQEVEPIHEAGILRLVAVSDEALLIDAGNVAAETRFFDIESNLRTVIHEVLTEFGAALEAGSENYTFRSSTTNLIINPKLDSVATGYAHGNTGGTATSARSTSSPPAGFAAFYRVTATNALNTMMQVQYGTGVGTLITGIQPLRPYAGYARFRYTGGTSTIVSLVCLFRDASTAIISTQVRDYPFIPIPGGAWHTIDTSSLNGGPFIAPEGAVTASLLLRRTGTTTNGATLDATGLMLLDSSGVPFSYFDGDTASTADYAYAWTGTPEASTSTRTALTNIADLSAFELEPGEHYWDFLNPLIQTAGLRLFCDENRDWWLVDPATYTVAGTVAIEEGVNARGGTDLRSLRSTRPDGSPVYFTGVVVTYRWSDADGIEHVRHDVAGTDEKIHRIEYRRPWPGNGAAAAILARAQGRGHTQSLVALTNLDATPGNTLTSALPDTPELEGIVSAVGWAWSAEGDDHDRMAVAARDLAEV